MVLRKRPQPKDEKLLNPPFPSYLTPTSLYPKFLTPVSGLSDVSIASSTPTNTQHREQGTEYYLSLS